MNKFELIDELSRRTGLTKIDSEKAYNGIFDSIIDALANGEKVIISGFGTFEVKERIARSVPNPRTKEMIDLPAIKIATFKTGKTLKEKVK